jgi:hypothetical protein
MHRTGRSLAPTSKERHAIVGNLAQNLLDQFRDAALRVPAALRSRGTPEGLGQR